MKKEPWIETILQKMTLEQKIGQCVVVGMSGTVITNDLKEAILRYECSGIRHSGFGRMFRYFSDDKAKQQELGKDFVPSMQKIALDGLPPYCDTRGYAQVMNELHDLAAQRHLKIPLHMIIDQEGDTSKDYARGGVVQFPSNMGLAASRSPELIYDVAVSLAKQIKAAGLDMIHSPVVDVNINPLNPEIGRRAFGDDPKLVAEYAVAMFKGFRDEDVIAAAKHFPGRGDSATDAHFACPVLDVSKSRLDEIELYPYRELIKAGMDAIMIAHCIYPQIHPEHISTVSRPIVHGILREELGFEGVITTDSITMGALIDRYGIGEACSRALAAGADTILMKAENQWRGEMFYTIKKWVTDGKIDADELDDKVRRVLKLKKKYGLFEDMGRVDAGKADEPTRDKMVIETSKKAAQNAILVVKDELNALPLDKNKKVLLINQQNSIKCPNDLFDHPALFAQLMEEDWPTLQTYETHFGYDKHKEEKVVQFVKDHDYALIICTNFYDRAARPHEYVKTLIDAGYPVLLITNTPYCIKETGGLIPAAQSAVLNMNLTPEGLCTTKAVLHGQLQPLGKWPLTLFDPFGLGRS